MPTYPKSIIWALSSTLDLVGVIDARHGQRVAHFACTLYQQAGQPGPWTLDDVAVAALLHDCGVSSTEIHERLVAEYEWACAQNHCERGAEMLSQNPDTAHLAQAIRLHHYRWQDHDSRLPISPDAYLGNLLFLADRLDVLWASRLQDTPEYKAQILHKLHNQSPLLFAPCWLDALDQCAKQDTFWPSTNHKEWDQAFDEWKKTSIEAIPYPILFSYFKIFGQCVDGKSHFNYEHSQHVAALAFQIASWMGLDLETQQRLSLAGLVHDLGHLRIPDGILAKPTALSPQEMAVVRRHSFDAFEILKKIPGLGDIAQWAVMHHENLDGSGYPYRLKGSEIPLEAQILAFAEVISALVQHRPYRKGWQAPEILALLQERIQQGQMRQDIGDCLIGRESIWMRIALRGS